MGEYGPGWRGRADDRAAGIPSPPRTALPPNRWLTPVVALLLLAGIVAGAVLVTSVARSQVHLDDGTVWVTSLSNRKAARFNVRNSEANGGVSSTAPRFDVAQHDDDTLLTEGGTVTGIRASTLAPSGRTTTGTSTDTKVGGGTAALLSTTNGNVWIADASTPQDAKPESSDPRMRLGSGGRIAVTHDGIVYGYRPADGMVLALDGPKDTTSRRVASLANGSGRTIDDFTVVGGTPVISYGGMIRWIDGSAATGSTGTLTLQATPTDDAQRGWVAAADETGLYSVKLSTGKVIPSVLSAGSPATPARPVSTGGCAYAAWSRTTANHVSVCSPTAHAPFSTLQSVSATSDLLFRTNHRLVVLNDVTNGNVWNPRDSTKVIRIPWNTLQTRQTKQRTANDDPADSRRNLINKCSPQSGRIRAENDSFGSRMGSRRILDVLRNDQQTDCSVLEITKVSAPSGNTVEVSPVHDGRYLQLDATGAHAGRATFTYDISDGHGQTSSATVTLTIEESDGNHVPKQSDTPPEYDVEQGASFTVNALGSFSDGDGDPLTLISATPRNSDQVTVSTRADGQLVFSAGSAISGRITIELTVSDGRATGTGMAHFTIHAANSLAAAIDPVIRRTIPSTDTSIDLSDYVHGTSARIPRLTAVDPVQGATITMNASTMTLTFSATATGTFYASYTVIQGSIAATGLARVEVRAATGQSAAPVPVNDVALLGADDTAIVEPLSNDVDPMGGVLSVTSVHTDSSPGITAGLVSHRRVYLTANQLPTEPIEITYTVANAVGTSQGTIVLQPPALTASQSAPRASDVIAHVRTGGVVSVDAIDHVSYADGTTVTLQSTLQYDRATFSGLVFVSGDNVRYQASDKPGSYRVIYTVKDGLGNTASAAITFSVHGSDSATKAAPAPRNVEAQVAAGQKVKIPVTLTGIDADGDVDMLLGLGNTAPSLGRITEVGADHLLYEAYTDSSGTDSFSYAVEDWTGQRAQAQIRVGVFRNGSNSGVFARNDEIVLRPNTAATVPVTRNDVSEDGSDLVLDATLEVRGITGATTKDDMIAFTTPKRPGTAHITYTVKNKAGLSDTAVLTVTTDPQAVIEPPTAYDYRVAASATIDKKSVDVDVSDSIGNPSGTAGELKVRVDPSVSAHARVTGGKHSTVITIDLTDKSRSVPYTVTNTTYGITSTAFIQVPAYGVFPPTLRPKAPALTVNGGETITIPIADHVRVGAGKSAYVESPDSVSATKSNGGKPYVDDQTLRFTAPRNYSGPASITFTAADAEPGDTTQKIVNSAVLTLSITVIGRTPSPPTFSSTTIDVVAGDDPMTVDLTALTHSPLGDDVDLTRYVYAGGTSSSDITATVKATGTLTVKAGSTARPGTTVAVPITIGHDGGTLTAGVTVEVTESTRPLARVTGPSIQLKAGASQKVDLFTDAYNPFPDTPLKAVVCTTSGTARLKADCAGSGFISITADADIEASTNRVLVTVQDATGSMDRQVTATILVSVIDKPDAPQLSPIAAKPADSSVDLSWTPGETNGSPVTEYKVDWDGGSRPCGTATGCRIRGLTNGREYSFSVRARNEAGWSKASNAVTGTPDVVPTAPRKVSVTPRHLAATVTWSAPDYVGTAPDSYTVTLNGPNGWSSTQTVIATSASFDGLSNSLVLDGTSFSATVTAHNRAGDGTPSAASASAKVWGDPDRPRIDVRQKGGKADIVVSLGDMHNAGCSSIRLSGGVTATLGCPGDGYTSTSADITADQYGTTVTYTATLNPNRDGAASPRSSTSLSPGKTVDSPGTPTISAENRQCKVSWTATDADDNTTFTVGYLSTSAAGITGTTFSFDPGAWNHCGGVTVTSVWSNGTVIYRSDSVATTGGGDTIPDKPMADVGGISVSWKDHDTIDISGSVDSYGQSANVIFAINNGSDDCTARNVDQKSCHSVKAPPTTVDVSDLPDASSYTWELFVTATDSSRSPLNNSTDEQMLGARPSQEQDSMIRPLAAFVPSDATAVRRRRIFTTSTPTHATVTKKQGEPG